VVAVLLVAVWILAGAAGSPSGGGSDASSPEREQAPTRGEGGSSPSEADRLFSPSSFWNAPLADGAPLDPGSGELVAELRRLVDQELGRGNGPWIETHRCSTPLYRVPADQRTVRVALDDPGASWRAGLQKAFEAVPIPAEARPANCSDLHMTVWQPATDRLWEFWRARKEADGWHASWGGAIKDVSRSVGYYTPDAWPGSSSWNWGATASSLPVIGGVMLLEELRRGSIDHALAMNVPMARGQVFSWPAQRSDGKSTNPNALPEGARLRLDPSLNIDRLDLPPLTRMMAEAAQRYGIVVRDQTSEAHSFFAEDPTPTGTDPYRGKQGFFGGKWPNELLADFPWDSLQVLKLRLCPKAPCTPD
jgi:hypothetical protein